jgi:hypothetical protein
MPEALSPEEASPGRIFSQRHRLNRINGFLSTAGNTTFDTNTSLLRRL